METRKMSEKEKHLLQQWQECGKWLHRIGFIREDHKLNSSSCSVPDFALFFRDGVTLCKLLNFIDSTSIDMSTVSQRPHNAQSLCKKNIKKFTSCCTRHFKLREMDVFTEEQLFEFTDFGRLLECLSKLSLCPKVQELLTGTEGFHLSVQPRDDEEEEIYRGLQDIANHNPGISHELSPSSNGNSASSLVSSGKAGGGSLCQGPADCSLLRRDISDDCGLRALQQSMRGSTAGPTTRKRDDEVYQSLCYVTFKLQEGGASADRGSGAARDKREFCLQELLETEKGYVKALTNLIKMFYKPLKEMLPDEQIDVLFSGLRSLTEVHQSLLQALTEAWSHTPQHSNRHSTASPQAAAVAQVFERFQERLLVYGEYCAQYPTALALLDDITANKANVRDKIKESEAAMSAEKHQLRDLMFVPVQRILKYPLLLHELIKNTNKSDPEYWQLKAAYEAMVDLAEYANEYKRDRETIKILEDVQASITDLPSSLADLKELGRMRLDGEIRIECHPEKIKARFVFLFDKALIMCKQSKPDEKYLYKDSVRLEGCRVDVCGGSQYPSSSLGGASNNSSPSTLGGSSDGGLFSGSGGGLVPGRKSNSFLLVVAGNKKAYTIIGKTEKERDAWLKAVMAAIENVNPSENSEFGHQFVLTTFTQINVRCYCCCKLLKGTIYQGYECRGCQLTCHRSCLRELCSQRPCEAGSSNSTCRLSSSPPPALSSMMAPPAMSSHHPLQGEWSEFWQADIRDLPWWAERMCRERAEEALQPTPQGTFLMRWSDTHCQPVVSLKVFNEVKHMRIHQELNDGRQQFYFCNARNFLTLCELVNYYHLYPLSEAFQELEERLLHPIYDSAVSLFEFRGGGSNGGSSSNYLQLQPGQRLVVLGRQGQDRGWWSGRSRLKTGFFPREFVKLDQPPVICL